MNERLSNIALLIQQSALPDEEKQKLLKEISNADKQWNILEFKLDRTEKVKKTTAVLLEETIEELEKKRKDVEIEAALERVRSVAIGMKERSDMLEVCRIISHQLGALGVKEIRNVQTAIFYESKGTYMNYEYYAKHDRTFITDTTYTNNEIHNAFAQQMLKGNGEFFITHIKDEKVKDWIAYQKTTNVFIDDYLYTASSLNYYWYSLGPVALGVSTYEPLSEDDINLFKRFLKVFELSYTRYLDIQQAIAQARESQIQLALERVRARTMAMQKSEELQETSLILFQQLKELGEPAEQLSIGIMNEAENVVEISATLDGKKFQQTFRHSGDEPFVMNKIISAWKAQQKSIIIEQSSEELEAYNKYRNELTASVKFPTKLQAGDRRILYVAFFSKGMLGLSVTEPRPKESLELLERFAGVFDLTYTRFLDLKNAEAQAREAQIETALERVRSRSMAMHKSDELKEVIRVVLEQFVHLNINAEHAGFYIDYKAHDDMHIWLADPNLEPFFAVIPYFDTPTWNSFLEAKTKGTALHTDLLNFEEKNKFYESLFKLFIVPEEAKQFYLQCKGLAVSTVLLNNVGLYIENFSAVPYTDEENKILMRFGSVFEQSYTRFLDLQKAEAQAKEAQIEAALERVRSRTLAMQKSDELAETSAVLFKQLIGLGISPNRLYISIIKNDEGDTEFWITDEDGSKVSMAYEDNLNNNPSFKKMYEGWKQQKKSLVIDMKGKVLKEYLNYLSSIHVPFKGGLTQKRRVQYIAYFSKGFIGMASPDEQPAETLQLLERFAYVFNLTFTRFNDLQMAEAHALQAEQDLIEIKTARKKAEETLNELQATQKQLIQSEKMASLGELTAGIAHEIQNPLNFVNNFSEVSKELIGEMKAALEKGDKEEADEIANDIIQNLEKINHHGKRADAIVKGMLQHSRKNSGQKEPTDINALADEYLRLSYHGLRAKDKTFNAGFKTDFDESIEKINIVPQDIGRVLLNLFNNAFYAVQQKRNLTGFENLLGLITVQTKKIHDKVEIIVEDNGNGIPQSIIDKIFQPFFTTKPTGQGTGLGLSLAYDIITKEHNGTIKVESKEGEGSTFIISLPVA